MYDVQVGGSMIVVLCWAGMPGPMFLNLFLNMPHCMSRN